MVDLGAIKVVLQRVGGGLECSKSLVDEARDQLKLVEEKFTPTNKPSAKPCAWCRGRVANKGIFGNYCSQCGFDLRTASHVGGTVVGHRAGLL